MVGSVTQGRPRGARRPPPRGAFEMTGTEERAPVERDGRRADLVAPWFIPRSWEATMASSYDGRPSRRPRRRPGPPPQGASIIARSFSCFSTWMQGAHRHCRAEQQASLPYFCSAAISTRPAATPWTELSVVAGDVPVPVGWARAHDVPGHPRSRARLDLEHPARGDPGERADLDPEPGVSIVVMIDRNDPDRSRISRHPSGSSSRDREPAGPRPRTPQDRQ